MSARSMTDEIDLKKKAKLSKSEQECLDRLEKAVRKKPSGHAAYTRTSKKTGKISQVQAKGGGKTKTVRNPYTGDFMKVSEADAKAYRDGKKKFPGAASKKQLAERDARLRARFEAQFHDKKSLEDAALDLEKAAKPYGHSAYTRTSSSGKISQVQAAGVKPVTQAGQDHMDLDHEMYSSGDKLMDHTQMWYADKHKAVAKEHRAKAKEEGTSSKATAHRHAANAHAAMASWKSSPNRGTRPKEGQDVHGIHDRVHKMKTALGKSLEDAALDRLEKAAKHKGPGSRGGNVIGNTKSGKPVYGPSARHVNMSHRRTFATIEQAYAGGEDDVAGYSEGFSTKDHLDAHKLHSKHAKAASKRKGASNDARELAHSRMAEIHHGSSNAKKSLEDAALDRLEKAAKQKGPGSRGGNVIGKTKSGKPIYGPSQKHLAAHRSESRVGEMAAHNEALKLARDHAMETFGYTRQDHIDAAKEHKRHAEKKEKKKSSVHESHAHFYLQVAHLRAVKYARKSLEDAALDRLHKAIANPDIDFDPGRMGVADYTATEGQVAMRVHHNTKCSGCNHYDMNMSACEIGVVPSVCGDGSHPEVGFSPAQPDRIAARNWMMRHKNAVVESAAAAGPGTDFGTVPFRIEVLGDSALSLAERMTLVKAAVQDKGALAGHIWHHVAGEKARAKWEHKGCGSKKPHEGKGRPPKEFIAHIANKGLDDPDVVYAVSEMTGEQLVPFTEMDLSKSRMSIDEFADAMGTTEDVVRSIARRLGNKHDFAEFIKSKLPDIRMAHGLTEGDVAVLYRAAQRTLKSLSSTQWELWKGVTFEDGVTDESLSRAIERNGLLDMNALHGSGIVTPAQPQANLPAPEPIQATEQFPIHPAGFVGGNLHLADDIGRMG